MANDVDFIYDDRPMQSTDASAEKLAANKLIIDKQIKKGLKILEENRQIREEEDAKLRRLKEWQALQAKTGELTETNASLEEEATTS